MTFLALLTKELRLRMRRERTIWVIIVYILLMGLLGWFFIGRFTDYNGFYNSNGLSDTGVSLYVLLSMVQLLLIVFITPAFTATTVNGEKERQTYDLLLCSRLSAFSLVSGKLAAGLMNALVVGTFGLFCSTVFSRPAVSTAIAYMAGVIWLIIPLMGIAIDFIWASVRPASSPNQFPFILVWNPVEALISTYPTSYGGGLAVTLGISRLHPGCSIPCSMCWQPLSSLR